MDQFYGLDIVSIFPMMQNFDSGTRNDYRVPENPRYSTHPYDTLGAFRRKTVRQDGRIRTESCATFGKIVRQFPRSHR